MGPAQGRAKVFARLRAQPGALAELTDGHLRYPMARMEGATLQLLDRLCPASAALVVTRALARSVESTSDQVEAALWLRSPELRRVVAHAAADGQLGRFTDPVAADRLRRWGAPAVRFATQLGGEALGQWLGAADDDDLRDWALHPQAARRLGAVRCAPTVVERAVAAMVDHTPGLLTELASPDCHLPLLVRDAVVSRISQVLGDGELEWLTLWSLAPNYPGTLSQATDVVAAICASHGAPRPRQGRTACGGHAHHVKSPGPAAPVPPR